MWKEKQETNHVLQNINPGRKGGRKLIGKMRQVCLRGGLGAGERARYLTALHALTEDPGSVPSTRVVLITAVWGDIMFSSDIPGHQS